MKNHVTLSDPDLAAYLSVGGSIVEKVAGYASLGDP